MPPNMDDDIKVDEGAEFMDSVVQRSKPNSLAEKLSRVTARNPLKVLFGTLTLSIVLSAIGVIVGKFKVEVDNKGWRSRGTVIANREMQNEVIERIRDDLFTDTDGSVWDDVQTNPVRGYESLKGREDGVRRNLFIDGCDANKYYSNMLSKKNLFAVYNIEAEEDSSVKSILDPDVLFAICEAETKTHKALEENGVCGGCDDSTKCLPPHSLLLVLRRYVDGLDLSCSDLKEKYTQSVQENFTNDLVECTQGILETYDSATKTFESPASCPPSFQVSLVDRKFGVDGNTLLRYSSSYFITYEADDEALYKVKPEYGFTDTNIVTSTYDTSSEVQTELYVDSILLADMALAVGSMTITFIAMAIHTKSIFLTIMGVFQIIFSVPLAYFVYYFIIGLRFFPFLNFIGVFVAAALGADYIFVTVDKWKNARLDNPSGSTEDVAAIALPDAASAMLLTTSTTAVAFFATTICPVTPILCFALFCGLMITFNYIMNIVLLFPSLCLYDIWLKKGSRNCLINFGCCARSMFEVEKKDTAGNEKKSLIHRILSAYYYYLHKFRYVIMGLCLIGTALCIYYAFTIKLPDSVDVRILPEDNEYEKHFRWRQQLLSFSLLVAGGSFGEVTFGVLPADTGARNDPDSLSTLVLDETFDPSLTEAQTYLLGFCDRIFNTDIVNPPEAGSLCPINEFDFWLRNQTVAPLPSDEYTSSCNGADSLPMSEEDFHSCFISWSRLIGEKNVLSNDGKVKIMRMKVANTVGWDAPFTTMDKFWNSFEDWLSNERSNAPSSVNKMFHTSGAFWWYDTNISMLNTAIGAAGIAIGFSTIVVLLASRSPSLTLFSAICITYVLAATTASLVGFGWNLGFLESVCFAILIGISCDFVIHFGHAYNSPKGKVSKNERTKFAVIHMGPSILAAAFTTFAAAIAMLFCTVVFFTKFALILLMTILHATIGSFIIYLVLSDTFGPSEPTKLFDNFVMKMKQKCCGKRGDTSTNIEDGKE